MDRRNFFKTIMAAPLLTPFLMASKQHNAPAELFLITDEPQRYVVPLLSALQKDLALSAGRFSFLTQHPREMELRHALVRSGWKAAAGPRSADLGISFSCLQDSARPSFSMVQEGKIQDIRTHSLMRLWQDMNRLSPSPSLTTLTIRRQQDSRAAAASVSVYQRGRAVARLSLQSDGERTFKASQGNITVSIHNGSASIAESSCRFQICRHSAPVFQAGERIVCAPNHFLLAIEGSGPADTVIG